MGLSGTETKYSALCFAKAVGTVSKAELAVGTVCALCVC